MDSEEIDALVVRSQAGDRHAYEVLARKYRSLVAATVRAVLVGPRWDDWREDVVQEAFFRAWRNVGTFDRRARFSTWLRTITFRVALDEMKKRHHWFAVRSQPIVARMLVRAGDPTTPIAVERALAQLDERYARPFLLAGLDGFTGAEIGAELGLKENTASTQVRRARLALQRLVSGAGPARGRRKKMT